MKRVTAFFLVAVLCLMAAVPAYAEGSVSYIGQAEKFIFEPGSKYSPSDLFQHFKNVMPGDTLTDTIAVRNDVKNNAKIRLYIRSLGAEKGSEDLLSQMRLTVTQDNGTQLFKAPANLCAQLGDWMYLGTVYSGGKVNLNLKLEVPITMGNEFQERVGKIVWEFKVEELPVEKDDPAPPTGDAAHLPLYAGIAGCSLVILVFLVIRHRKQERLYGRA